MLTAPKFSIRINFHSTKIAVLSNTYFEVFTTLLPTDLRYAYYSVIKNFMLWVSAQFQVDLFLNMPFFLAFIQASCNIDIRLIRFTVFLSSIAVDG